MDKKADAMVAVSGELYLIKIMLFNLWIPTHPKKAPKISMNV
ncbi:hypothetical protein [Allomuricauda sp. CAU 1633]|nr:hypothetical protein [Muricauda sp. CAU 1633]